MEVDNAFSDQRNHAFCFAWGAHGLASLAGSCAVIVVVDVLRFTSAVSAAIEAGARVWPYPWDEPSAPAFATQRDAVLGGRREEGGPSLSPADLLRVSPGTRLVLPSPNGSALSYTAGRNGVAHVLAGCLRNATAVAASAAELSHGAPIGVVAAGERWPDGSLRPCVEDLLGAGAVLAALDPSAATRAPMCSPEALAARAGFLSARAGLYEAVHACHSGRELLARGWGDDVALCSALDVTDRVPRLVDGCFVAA